MLSGDQATLLMSPIFHWVLIEIFTSWTWVVTEDIDVRLGVGNGASIDATTMVEVIGVIVEVGLDTPSLVGFVRVSTGTGAIQDVEIILKATLTAVVMKSPRRNLLLIIVSPYCL